MDIGYDAELETRIILKLLTKAGFEIRKVMSSGNYSEEEAFGKPEESEWWNEWVVGKSEDEITKIANNFDDCMLIVKKDGRDGWLRFVYGNGWGELICDHSGDLSHPHANLFGWHDSEGLLGLHYESWDIGEVFELFGLRKQMTLMELIENYKEMRE